MKNRTKNLAFIFFGILVITILLFVISEQKVLSDENLPSPIGASDTTSKEHPEGASRNELTLYNYSELMESLSCERLDILQGNPVYWDSAVGINCYLNERESILIRIFAQESVLKIIGDWDEVVTPGNQLVYSKNWFATGPPEELHKVFQDYSYIDIVSHIPTPEEMSDDELSVSMCSSTIYNIIQESLIEGYSQEKYSEYYKYYPQGVVEEIYHQLKSDGDFETELGEGWYKNLGKIAVHDKKIKDSCRENPW